MVMTYTCIRKCYFLERICNVGDKLILDIKVGDSCPHLMRTPTDEQLAMQAEPKETKTEASVPKAEAKVAFKGEAKKPTTKNGSKTE